MMLCGEGVGSGNAKGAGAAAGRGDAHIGTIRNKSEKKLTSVAVKLKVAIFKGLIVVHLSLTISVSGRESHQSKQPLEYW